MGPAMPLPISPLQQGEPGPPVKPRTCQPWLGHCEEGEGGRQRPPPELKPTPLPLLSPCTAFGARLLLTCPGLTPVGTGLDQADGVGVQAAAMAGSSFAVSGTPVQVQHVAQGLPACWPCSPAPAAWCPHLQGLQEGQGGDRRQGAGGQHGLICSPGKGHSEEEEEAGEGMEQSHDRWGWGG